MKVELIFDEDCPNVPAVRELLVSGFSHVNLQPAWKEIDRAKSAAHAQLYGSPTILVNGQDVSASQTNTQSCCRIFLHDEGFRGLPQLNQLITALQLATESDSHRSFAWPLLAACLPSLSALLPLLQCPACWPAYSAIFTSLGLGFLLENTFAAPVICIFLVIALISLGYGASVRHGYFPLALGCCATIAIVLGKFFYYSDVAVFGGVAALFVAAVWNCWPTQAFRQART